MQVKLGRFWPGPHTAHVMQRRTHCTQPRLRLAAVLYKWHSQPHHHRQQHQTAALPTLLPVECLLKQHNEALFNIPVRGRPSLESISALAPPTATSRRRQELDRPHPTPSCWAFAS